MAPSVSVTGMRCVGLRGDPLAHVVATDIGRPRKARQAETAAHLELQPIESIFRAHGWNAAVGASGTIRAIGAVLKGNVEIRSHGGRLLEVHIDPLDLGYRGD